MKEHHGLRKLRDIARGFRAAANVQFVCSKHKRSDQEIRDDIAFTESLPACVGVFLKQNRVRGFGEMASKKNVTVEMMRSAFRMVARALEHGGKF